MSLCVSSHNGLWSEDLKSSVKAIITSGVTLILGEFSENLGTHLQLSTRLLDPGGEGVIYS